jgi:hypothetical protein
MLIRHFTPRRQVELDIGTNAVAVTTGTHVEAPLPNGTGKIDFKQVARASVQREHPEGAHVTEQTTVDLDMSNGSSVLVTTNTWHSARGMAARGRVELDGHLFFEREWRG